MTSMVHVSESPRVPSGEKGAHIAVRLDRTQQGQRWQLEPAYTLVSSVSQYFIYSLAYVELNREVPPHLLCASG